MNKISIIKEAAEKASSEENKRAEQLVCRAEKLVTSIIIITAFQLFNVRNLLESPSSWTKAICYSSLPILSLSLFLGLYGTKLKGHTAYPRGDQLLENLTPHDVSQDAAEKAIIQLLLKTREQNAKLNDAKVRLLSWCRWLFFAGFLLVVAGRFLAALEPPYAL
jgi:hypothetical protein